MINDIASIKTTCKMGRFGCKGSWMTPAIPKVREFRHGDTTRLPAYRREEQRAVYWLRDSAIRRNGILLTPVKEKQADSAWQEYRRRSRPLIVDLLMWITVIAGMTIVFAMLRILKALGYGTDHIAMLESIHFIASAAILVVVGFDTFMKVLAFLVGGR
jgi:hypothetical protein